MENKKNRLNDDVLDKVSGGGQETPTLIPTLLKNVNQDVKNWIDTHGNELIKRSGDASIVSILHAALLTGNYNTVDAIKKFIKEKYSINVDDLVEY